MKKFTVALLILAVFASLLTGCTTGINEETLSYFQNLTGQKYWTDKPLSIEFEKDDGQKAILFADTTPGTFEGIELSEVKITETSKNGKPQKGYILSKIINNDGEELRTYNLAINNKNKSTTENLLSLMKTDEQKITIDSRNLIDTGNFDLAIAKLKNIQMTDEVKSLLDSAYYGIGKKQFDEENYDGTISALSNIQYDSDTIQKGKELSSKAQLCKQLLADAQELINNAEYSEAKEKLLQVQQLNNSKLVKDLLNEMSDPWLLEASAIKEAIAYGKSHKNSDLFALEKPWSFGFNAIGILSYRECINVGTPYHSVVFLAWDNAAKYKDTTLEDALKVLHDLQGQLRIAATIFGDEVDFGENIDAVIKVNGKYIQPVESVKDNFADTTDEWPYSPAYRVTNGYYFDLKDIPRNAKIQFILIYHPTQKEIKFDIDLSKMK